MRRSLLSPSSCCLPADTCTAGASRLLPVEHCKSVQQRRIEIRHSGLPPARLCAARWRRWPLPRLTRPSPWQVVRRRLIALLLVSDSVVAEVVGTVAVRRGVPEAMSQSRVLVGDQEGGSRRLVVILPALTTALVTLLTCDPDTSTAANYTSLETAALKLSCTCPAFGSKLRSLAARCVLAAACPDG
jgi:hypothetical protein